MSDKTIWAIILVMSAYLSIIDCNVVHRDYEVGVPMKSMMSFHQLIIMTVLIGLFFREKLSIRIHLGIVFLAILLWVINKGCILTQNQKNSIQYTTKDSIAIHGTHDEQFQRFLILMVPSLLFDVYKLVK
jgi:hypothetical protein